MECFLSICILLVVERNRIILPDGLHDAQQIRHESYYNNKWNVTNLCQNKGFKCLAFMRLFNATIVILDPLFYARRKT